MTPDVRLIAVDLDGTLLRDDMTVSERTRRSIARVQEMGIVVVLVTARPPRVLCVIAQDVGMTGLGICCNGAIVYDLAAEAIVQHAPLPAMVAQRLVAALREAAPGVCFAVEQGLRFGQEPRYAALHPAIGDHRPLIDTGLALCATDVTKLIVLHPELPLQNLLRITREIAGDEAIVTHSSTLFVEVSAAGVTKAMALGELCSRLGIDATRVIAFGDMPNDLPMLQWAGHSVAVANAHPDVLTSIDEVTLSNNEDGVALVLDRLVPQRSLRLGFLASHGGSGMTAILDAIRRGQLDAGAQVVISNNGRSAALATARGAGIPNYHLSETTVGSPDDLDVAIRDALVRHDVNLVILSGYMKKIGPKTLDTFRGRILNVHPALLPKYGGHGMYGRNVHAAVLAAGETETGVTIHLVDEEYDHGRIIGQATVPVLTTDTVDSLAARVLEREKTFFVELLQRIDERGLGLL